MNKSQYIFLKLKKSNLNINSLIYRGLSSNLTSKYAKPKELSTGYKPEIVEVGKYEVWEKEKRFTCDINEGDNAFSLVLPPPNVTGSLHLGHALTTTLQDVLCRYNRMLGIKVTWLPGTDHAGIATQTVVEKKLFKNGTSRHDLGREKFEFEVWKWKEKHGGLIQKQLRKLGASLDWTKEVFTMDEKQSKAVKFAFIKLFNDGLIYRADRLVNWSCELQSTISDIEVDNIEISGPTLINVPGYVEPIKFGFLTEFAYKLKDENGEIIVATTRPETMLGDVAIAVNPEDERYSNLVGKEAVHPFLDRCLPIVKDEYVDTNFGTGALKITPAHDRNDYEIALRHHLPVFSIINDSGRLKDNCGVFSGLKRYDARQAVLDALNKRKLLRCVKEHAMTLPFCSRSKDVVELLPRAQWYINCKEMAAEALRAVETGNLTFVPDLHASTWTKWLTEERDWCISRQLWWGHKIPAYKCYHPDNPDKFIWIAAENQSEAALKASTHLSVKMEQITCEQDTDVLDTWFSSGIYPFSSFGWPEETKDFKQLYPLSLMVTGHDILCFWVCRMVMLGSKLTQKLPFNKVLLHGVICDAKGAKMSKSKGNVIQPEDVINGITLQGLNDKAKASFDHGYLTQEEYSMTLEEQKKNFPSGINQCGVDALRFTLCSRNVMNHFIQFDVDECYSNKLFCNKIWQCIKYTQNVYNIVNDKNVLHLTSIKDFSNVDLWILSRLSFLVQQVKDSVEEYNFHFATTALKDFLYHEMCDVYIECTKFNLKSLSNRNDSICKLSSNCHVFSFCLNTALRCLAPFMPYLVEEVLSAVPLKENCILEYTDTEENLKFPNVDYFKQFRNDVIEEEMNLILNIITAVRKMKTNYNISKKIEHNLNIECRDDSAKKNVTENLSLLKFLCKCTNVAIKNSVDLNSLLSSFVNNGLCKVELELLEDGVVEKCKNYEKLEKKRMMILKNIKKMEVSMNSDGYRNKVSQNVQKMHREKLNILKEDLQKYKSRNS